MGKPVKAHSVRKNEWASWYILVMRWDEIEDMRRAAEWAREIQREGGFEAYNQRIRSAQDALVHRQERFDDPRSITEAMKIAEQARNTNFNLLFETLETARNNETRRLLENLNDRFRLPDEFLNPGLRIPHDVLLSQRLLEDYGRSFQTQMRDLDQGFSYASQVFEQIRTSGTVWTDAIRFASERVEPSFTSRVIEASLAWRVSTEALTERFGALNLTDSHPLLAQRLVQPSRVFTRFSGRTFKRLEKGTSEHDQVALSGSLILAEDQLIDASTMLETTVVVPTDAEGPSGPTIYNNFGAQQQDLLANLGGTVIPEPSQLLDLSPAAQLIARSRRCISLVAYCNKANCLRGGRDIFKPTTRFVEACNDLPWIVAQDQHTLATFVESLYFILYEAAGARDLRFITEGFMSVDDCDAVMSVKFLRNKWLSHDPDHGSEGDVRRTWRDLNECLKHLGIATMPLIPADFMQLQRRVLEEVEGFLEQLVRRINEVDSLAS
jgi:hypothetical protein